MIVFSLLLFSTLAPMGDGYASNLSAKDPTIIYIEAYKHRNVLLGEMSPEQRKLYEIIVRIRLAEESMQSAIRQMDQSQIEKITRSIEELNR